MLFSLTVIVCIYNEDILYVIYYNNILCCYVAENRTLLLNKANIFTKNIIKTVFDPDTYIADNLNEL